MVDVGDLEVGVFLQDQAPEGGALVVQRDIGDGLEGRLERG